MSPNLGAMSNGITSVPVLSNIQRCPACRQTLREHTLCGGRRHPKWKTQILTTWLLQHWPNAFPTEEEKETFSRQLQMTKKQVDNWFINGQSVL